MLVGRRMVHDVGAVFFKHRLDPVGVPDGADEHHQVQVRILLLQLQLDVVGVVFVDIKDDQLLRVMACHLAAQLASDGAASPGH